MAKRITPVFVDLNELDEVDLLEFVADKFYPEQVYTTEALTEWATENGFVKAEEGEA